jgi:hypothetical protein
MVGSNAKFLVAETSQVFTYNIFNWGGVNNQISITCLIKALWQLLEVNSFSALDAKRIFTEVANPNY